ncbi:MAG: MFS transporter [Acidimicrobiales bacterium]
MSVRRYRQVMRVPGFNYLMGTSLLARLPLGMTSLAVVLLVSRGGSYVLAGLVVAVYVTGCGVAGPVLGRLVDRFDRSTVLRPAAVAEAAGLCALALLPVHATAWILACALAAGLCTPPVTAAARSLWPELLPVAQVPVVYAIEATLQELVYIVGPAIVALVVSLSSPSTAVIASAGVLVAGVMAFSVHPATRQAGSTVGVARGPTRRGMLVSAPVLAAALLIVGAFNYVELSTVAFARDHGSAGAAGVVLAAWSAGSLLGGLVFGSRAASVSAPQRRLAALIALVAAGSLLPALASQVWVLGLLLFCAGVAIAPTFAALYSLAAAEAPSERRTEAFGWLSTAFQAGSALGALTGGVVVQAAGPHVGYLAAAGVLAMASPGLLLASRRAPLSAGVAEAHSDPRSR